MANKEKGFWNKLTGLFKPKEEAKPIKEEYEMPIPTEQEEKKECFFCKMWINEGDRWSKQQNKWFHRKCYKKFIQSGRQGKIVE